jgi:hypothetical protein
MTSLKTTPSTDIRVNASLQDVVRILAAQYAHMAVDEARAALGRLHDPVWSDDELLEQFEIASFKPPYVHVSRKKDGIRGTVAYIDSPRLYFDFQPEENYDTAKT